jgi:tRNA U34 5-carboxymethylaminomethyl modifying enzyme MnmG/GidA
MTHYFIVILFLHIGDGLPRSAAMVLSMPHTTLMDVVDIIRKEASNCRNELSGESNIKFSNVCADLTVDKTVFDTVEATCKYDVYLKKQEHEMNR